MNERSDPFDFDKMRERIQESNSRAKKFGIAALIVWGTFVVAAVGGGIWLLVLIIQALSKYVNG